ncbi:opacity protein [Chryseobacterium shigense]|uniref:Outer membrane protein beta-barrel domain-containing protein n=1 Tax=Chryseobacterium shigense TaxID=297244 RepID=A0A1N7HW55_9FLAO|nr:outer membrane beta-barrel protein [Chryseobacterium shigense]PQA91959.1 opacity protein [Chryseobacterium shigense]SIS29094.1 Outer membrane protein beta-barrel domain-containing protein [Chryseobacterium shigense]
MKKLVLAGAIALFGLSNAQIAKGTTYVSGTLNFSSTENNNNNKTNNELTLVPTVGYFVASNVAVGVGVGYASATEKVDGDVVDTKFTKSAVVVEPFVRKYWTLGEKFFIFGQLSVPMQFGNDKNEVSTSNTSVTTKEKFNSIGVAVKPGLDYFLNKNWTLEATIGEFGYSNFKYKDAKSVNNYNFGLDLASVGIGVKYVFAK